MKAIMISIKPKWVAKILNGEKTIEIRKNKALAKAIQKLIDENGYADIYVYCSKTNYLGYISNRYVGKVVFKFRCYKVEELYIRYGWGWETKSIDDVKVLESKTCLTRYDFAKYLKGKIGYAIYISDLEIFDKPKELSEIRCVRPTIVKNIHYLGRLIKAPQNFCYVEVLE